MKSRLLIVEDDPLIVELLEYNLEQASFDTEAVFDGTDALEAATEKLPDLILLDLLLPTLDGLEVCRMLKRDPSTRDIPIIMITAKGEEIDRIVGLELGADDYIAKPFSPREVVLRVRAVLRRAGTERLSDSAQAMGIHGLRIDLEKHQVSGEDGLIQLTATEFKLLTLMASSPGRVFTRAILMGRVWGTEHYSLDRTIDTHISRLRRKLKEYGDIIETVQGVGYRLRE